MGAFVIQWCWVIALVLLSVASFVIPSRLELRRGRRPVETSVGFYHRMACQAQQLAQDMRALDERELAAAQDALATTYQLLAEHYDDRPVSSPSEPLPAASIPTVQQYAQRKLAEQRPKVREILQRDTPLPEQCISPAGHHYKVLAGIDYCTDRWHRAEIGEILDNLPGLSIPGLISSGAIEPACMYELGWLECPPTWPSCRRCVRKG
jgi:hypothetical protein